MNKTCTNHPGAVDHNTAECPWNTEKSHGLERGAAAQKIDCLCAGGMAGAAPQTLERIRDNLKCSLNMGGLRDAAQWTIEELDRLMVSLPVGVPDGYALVPVEPTPEMLAATTTSKHAALRAEVMRMMREDYRAMLAAAPTVKAEQVRYSVEDLQQEGLNAGLQYVRESDDHYVTGTTEQALEFIRNMIGVDIRLTDADPSLPAAGSDVEEVEVVAHFQIPTGGSYAGERFPRLGPVPETPAANRTYEPLMTVAQHNRIVAALSAQQSAPDRVSVPVELLERVTTWREGDEGDSGRSELRALLDSIGRGEA